MVSTIADNNHDTPHPQHHEYNHHYNNHWILHFSNQHKPLFTRARHGCGNLPCPAPSSGGSALGPPLHLGYHLLSTGDTVITYALGHNPHTNAMLVGVAYHRTALPLNFTTLTTTTTTTTMR